MKGHGRAAPSRYRKMADKPQVTGTTHVLPFERLSPLDFERLCLWLVRREGYENAEHLGAAGGEQGRDIVARRDGRRVAFQCKRVGRLDPGGAEKEIAKLQSLPSEDQPDDVVFVVSTSVSVTTRDRARAAWGDLGSCDFWAGTELDERVKQYADLLHEFFDLGLEGFRTLGPAVKACGLEQLAKASITDPFSTRLLLSSCPWYVAGLRPRELSIAHKILYSKGVLEITGAPGVGKSTIAEELIQTDALPFLEVDTLRGAKTSEAVARYLRAPVSGISSFGTSGFIEKPCVIWIRSYSNDSRAGLLDFLHLELSISERLGRPHWILESNTPLAGLDHCRIEISTLNDSEIGRILEHVPPGQANLDPEVIIRNARGNPRRAVRLWHSSSSQDAEIGNDYEWFNRLLPREEAQLLCPLCVAARASPFGMTLSALSGWLVEVFSDRLPSEIKATTESLCSRLDYYKLAVITQIDQKAFGGLLNEIIADFGVLFITRMSSGIVSHVLENTDEIEIEDYEQGYFEFLLSTEDEASLPYVTAALNLGDLGPFLFSPFRYTFLRELLSWIDRVGWRPESERQAFILKSLRILYELGRGHHVDVVKELGRGPADHRGEVFCFEATQAHAMLRWDLDNLFDLDAWLRRADKTRDPDLKAELAAAAAMALPSTDRKDRVFEIWSILRDFLEDSRPDNNSWCRIAHQASAFINRSKLRRKVLDTEEAFNIAKQLSQEIVRYGSRTGNLQLICDGIFYWVRSQELRTQIQKSRFTHRDVGIYRTALGVLERSQVKTVRRWQLLLTQGSVHRHYCRRSDLAWPQFEQHMKMSFEFYRRSARSALVEGHVLHTLNAISYMSGLCRMALRFAQEEKARAVIRGAAHETLSYVIGMVPYRDRVSGPEERNIFSTIQWSVGPLVYIDAVARARWPPDLEDQLKRVFSLCVDAYLDTLTSARRSEFHKHVKIGLRTFLRAVRFGEAHSPLKNKEIIRMLHSSFIQLLDATKYSGSNRALWKKLSSAVL